MMKRPNPACGLLELPTCKYNFRSKIFSEQIITYLIFYTNNNLRSCYRMTENSDETDGATKETKVSPPNKRKKTEGEGRNWIRGFPRM